MQATLDSVDRGFEMALRSPESSALLRMFLAQYIRYYHQNSFVEMLHLKMLQQASLPFDLAFFVAQRNRDIRLAQKASLEPGTMTVETHMKLEVLRSQTNRLVLAAREQQAAFWVELSLPTPSLSRLDEIGTKLGKCIHEAHAKFERMMKLNANSVTTLRAYAQFASEVRLCFSVGGRVT